MVKHLGLKFAGPFYWDGQEPAQFDTQRDAEDDRQNARQLTRQRRTARSAKRLVVEATLREAFPRQGG